MRPGIVEPVSFFFEAISDAIHKAVGVVDSTKSVGNVQENT